LNQPEELIKACISGDRNSQSELYARFAPKMFGVCMRYSKNRQEAEEIMQEGFVQVFKSMHGFKNTGSFEGWIRKIMVNCSIQQYRTKQTLYPVNDIGQLTADIAGNDEILSRLQKKDLLKMVQALPPAYRMVFNLYVFEGMKHREIASLLGISEGTSKSNFYDAKLILQKAIAYSMRIVKNY
jgi:RNA polymerase sigma factor (sigma-70 family)